MFAIDSAAEVFDSNNANTDAEDGAEYDSCVKYINVTTIATSQRI